jgi:5-hydroxyisourate hydrolase
MSPITTHVLDTARGGPAPGIKITLEIQNGDGWNSLSEGVTNDDGRVADLMQPGELQAATYRITFHTQSYFEKTGTSGFYPSVPVIFTIAAPDEHYHVPLLISPFGYSTYRGS